MPCEFQKSWDEKLDEVEAQQARTQCKSLEASAGARFTGQRNPHKYRCPPRFAWASRPRPGIPDVSRRRCAQLDLFHLNRAGLCLAEIAEPRSVVGLSLFSSLDPHAVEWYNGRTGRGHDAPFALGITVASLPADTVIPLLPLQRERTKISRSKRKRSRRRGPLRPSE